AALPECIADHSHRAVGSAAAGIVGVGEAAAEHRRDTERVEQAGRRPDTLGELFHAAVCEIELLPVPGERVLEETARPELLPDRIRPRIVADRRVVGDEREPLRLFYG